MRCVLPSAVPARSRRGRASTRSAIMSIAVVERRAPPTRCRTARRYLTFVSRSGLVCSRLRRRALGAEPAARDRARRVALDLGHLAVLARRRAGRSRRRRTGRSNAATLSASVDTWPQRTRALGLRRPAGAERVSVAELADDGPAPTRFASPMAPIYRGRGARREAASRAEIPDHWPCLIPGSAHDSPIGSGSRSPGWLNLPVPLNRGRTTRPAADANIIALAT